MKVLAAGLSTALFVVVLAVVYTVHIWYFPVAVVFYSAIEDAVIAALLTGGALVAFRRWLPFNGFESTLLFVIWLVGGYAFAISGPALIDRSLSFYILEKLQQRGGGIREDSIGRLFMDEYMPEFRLVDVRLTEQTQSGTIEIVNGCVRLTQKGDRLASISRYLRTHFLAKHRLLAGVYTDALVDPFAKSSTGPQGYECH